MGPSFLLLPLIVHKMLPVFVQPLGLCFVFGVAALVMKKRWPAVAGLAILWIGSLGVVSGRLIGTLENQYPMIEVAACPEADAVVVLGGILNDDPRTATLEWGSAVNRFERGVDLLRAGRARYLVFMSARLPWQREQEPDEGSLLRQAAIERGIASEQILLTDGVVQNTAGEAKELKLMMDKRGWRTAVVVTSAYHMPRAMLLMRRHGVDAIAFPVDFNTHPGQARTAMDWLPSSDTLRVTDQFIRELLGLVYYGVLARQTPS